MEKENLNFDTDVLSRSEDVPVLVDFWSPNCGPCLVLGPVLDKLASEAGGKWELIKVNTMFNQDIAAEYQIQSIPAVKLFYKGKIINEFVGSMPEDNVQKWLEEFLPSPEKEELEFILEGIQTDRTTGMAKLEAFIAAHPELGRAQLALANELLWTDPVRSKELLTNFDKQHLLYGNAENMSHLADILLYDDAANNEVGQKLSACKAALADKNFEGAFSNIIDAMALDKTFADELPRRGAIAMLRLFGMGHPLVQKYRKRFETAMYA